MAIVNTREMLLKATKEKYAVGAFNITNIIKMEAVVEAAAIEKNFVNYINFGSTVKAYFCILLKNL
jgi:fructose/tagatose bisphosphate aldolase